MSGAQGKARIAPRQAPEQVQENLSRLQNDLEMLARKVGELDLEKDEHDLVLATLSEVAQGDPDRKCFRLVGSVLTERTVKDVIPDLRVNSEGIKRVIQNLTEQYNKKEEEFNSFKKKLDSSSVVTS